MGKYLDLIRQAKEVPAYHSQDRERAQTPPAGMVAPGCLITWQVYEGEPQGPATVEFLHTDPDGTVWAFVTLPDGWAAVNTKYMKPLDGEALS